MKTTLKKMGKEIGRELGYFFLFRRPKKVVIKIPLKQAPLEEISFKIETLKSFYSSS